MLPDAKAPNPPPPLLKLNADLAAPSLPSAALGVDGEEPAKAPKPEVLPKAEPLPKAEVLPNADVLPNAEVLPNAVFGDSPGLAVDADCGAKLNALTGLLLGLPLSPVGLEKAPAPKPKPGLDLNEPNADAVEEPGFSLLGAKLNAEGAVDVKAEPGLEAAGLASALGVGGLALGG